MKLDLTWGELARAAGGRLTRGDGADRIDALSTDTRALKETDAFLALVGERVDAHSLLNGPNALKAAGWIVARGKLAAKAAKPAHLIVVPDTLKALQAIAHNHRRRFEIPIVGVAGSNGKTTTREMLVSICALVGPTCSSPGNWNNEVGVPLSLLELTGDHRYGVFELAACRRGEIAELARVAQPTVGVLTNIGSDHLETFGTIETTFQTNSELVEALPEDGIAVINADDPWLSALEPRLGARAVTYGAGPRCRVRLDGADGLIVDRHRIQVKLKSFGSYSRYNAAAAAAAAWALGIPPDTIRRGLEAHAPGRLRQEPLAHASGAAFVLDAYNANPASMRASIEAFIEEFKGSAKTLILGDMKELGPGSPAFHRELGEWLAALDLKAVYLAGPEMKPAADALRAARPGFAVEHGDDPAAFAVILKGKFSAGDAVLFKASRAMKLETLAKAL
ncbi:MAG TPA: UDP-N-acetylmuramoyl-tripeptide--D-alanyl-D-alanine ligase [Elusimicrobiota bacterium]|jgi:UDP-N-acetylmuramoyl-tripeptide--D-alanyl-D-alanine ligase|nr:UDP-N-acetylmuramoyl-tripeptide--D-alanyl-D-alanine ligase [Elusimicrobiota bacterium]